MSAYQQIEFEIEGVVPCIQHNGQLSNPMNDFARAMKAISGKRKKTDEDFAELARIEFLGSLYLDENRHVCWPGENIERMLLDAAKKTKQGTQAKIGLLVDGNSPLVYSGPKEPEKLWEDKRFVHTVSCKVQTNRVMRTRPIFRQWSLAFVVSFLPDILEERDVRTFVETAGTQIGLSEWRPKFGRYVVK